MPSLMTLAILRAGDRIILAFGELIQVHTQAAQAAEETEKMSTRTLNHGLWWWIIGAAAAAALWIMTSSVAAAKVLVRPATQTTYDQTAIGPADVPVRMAVFTSADRDQLKVQPARWWGGWGWGYRAPYYAYYSAPYYSAPYYSYYSPSPYYAYYAPPTYYSATPYYSYYAPYYQTYVPPIVTYRYPRRAFYGAWYW